MNFIFLALIAHLMATFSIQAQIIPANLDGQINSSFKINFGENEQFDLQIKKIVGLSQNYSFELPFSVAGANKEILFIDKKNYIYLFEHKKTQINGYLTTYIISEKNHQYKLQLKATEKFPINGTPYLENNNEWEEFVPGKDRIIGSNIVGPCTTGGTDTRGRFMRRLTSADTLTTFKEKFYHTYVDSEEFFIILCSKDQLQYFSQESIGNMDEFLFDRLKAEAYGIVRRRYQL